MIYGLWDKRLKRFLIWNDFPGLKGMRPPAGDTTIACARKQLAGDLTRLIRALSKDDFARLKHVRIDQIGAAHHPAEPERKPREREADLPVARGTMLARSDFRVHVGGKKHRGN